MDMKLGLMICIYFCYYRKTELAIINLTSDKGFKVGFVSGMETESFILSGTVCKKKPQL